MAILAAKFCSSKSGQFVLGAALLTALMLAFPAAGARAGGGPDARIIVIEQAEEHGVSARALLALVNCESRFDPRAIGDYGTALGLVQLSTLRTGLYRHFLSLGYTDPMDARQAADYLARVASGEFVEQAITLKRWSCYGQPGTI